MILQATQDDTTSLHEPSRDRACFIGMRSLLFAVIAAFLCGCARIEQKPQACYGPTEPMSQVVQEINDNNAKINTLWARHSFEATLVDDKGKSRTFSGDGYLLFMKPDNLLLTAGGIIKYFEIGSNPQQYWFTAFPDEISTQWYGDKQRLTDAGAKQIPIRPDLLLEVLGVSSISDDFLAPPVPTMRFNNDACAYMFTWNKPLTDRWVAEKEVWYDHKTKLPKLILLFDANGRIILRAYLSDHKPIEGAGGMIATKYELFFPETKSQMSFHLTEVRRSKAGKVIIPNPGSFAFPQEPGVKKQIEIK
jgi:hypothetical protein